MPTKPPIQLQVGDTAPAIRLLNQHEETIELAQFKGQHVILYFYPKDNTPGCNKEACAFRDAIESFEAENVVVLGVSTDPVRSHQRFATKFELPFSLLADEDRKVVQAYGVWGEKQFMGRTFDGTFRASFLIDPKGKIKKIWPKVKPEAHPAEVLEAL